MIQDQITQTNDSHDSITEQDNEQVLQNINGGGLGCAVAGALSCADAGYSATKVMQTGSLKEAAKSVLYAQVAANSLKTASTSPTICPNCAKNIIQYANVFIASR